MTLEYTEGAVDHPNIDTSDQITEEDRFVLLGISKNGPSDGNRGVTISPKAFKSLTSIQGATGAQGEKGERGERGPQGLRGPAGTAQISEEDWNAFLERLDTMGYMPLGCISIYVGAKSNIPSGCRICDGGTIKVGPEDGDASAAFFQKMGWDETKPNTLPDLRDKFIKGDTTARNTGGKNTYKISESQLPTHNHAIDDFMYAPNGIGEINVRNPNIKIKYLDAGKRTQTQGGVQTNNPQIVYRHTTENAGSSAEVDNRPAFYSVIYIIRVK